MNVNSLYNNTVSTVKKVKVPNLLTAVDKIPAELQYYYWACTGIPGTESTVLRNDVIIKLSLRSLSIIKNIAEQAKEIGINQAVKNVMKNTAMEDKACLSSFLKGLIKK